MAHFVTISTTDPRSVRALGILAKSDKWLSEIENGRIVYNVPGTPNQYGTIHYRTTAVSCTCPDAKERGARCKHQIAVKLYQMMKGG